MKEINIVLTYGLMRETRIIDYDRGAPTERRVEIRK